MAEDARRFVRKSEEDLEVARAIALQHWRAANPGADYLSDLSSADWCAAWVVEHYPAVARAYALAGLVVETETEMYAILAVYPDLDPRQVRDDAAARVLARRQPTGPPD